jgi:hypothetical protein
MTNFSFTINSMGERVYQDSNVMKAYVNLGRLSDFIGNCSIKTDLEYTNICMNVSASGNTNTTRSFLINLLVGGFEFMGDVEFPWVGKMGGKIAGWLLSSLVDTWRDSPPDSLLNDFNNVWNGTKQAYNEAKLAVDTWRENLDPINGPNIWTKQYVEPKTKDIITISQLGSIDYLPDHDTPEYDNGAIAVANESKYMINEILVPTAWYFSSDGDDNWYDCYYTRWNDSHPYDGPFYDGLSIQTLFGITTSFPDMDVVDSMENANHYVYFSKESVEDYRHNWFSNDRNYVGTKYKRWNFVNKNDGGVAPDTLIKYLFKDGPGGDPTNGIASHDDVFNWYPKNEKCNC